MKLAAALTSLTTGGGKRFALPGYILKYYEGREERGGKEKKFLFLSNVSRLKFEIFYNFQSTRLKDKRFPIA